MPDSFDFHGPVTTNGPAAFGTGAQAWSGPEDTAWRGQLVTTLAQLRDDYEHSKPTMEPATVDSIQVALGGTTDALRARPFDRAAALLWAKRLAAVASTVGALAAAAEKIRELTSGG
jgi:hypothetical protein